MYVCVWTSTYDGNDLAVWFVIAAEPDEVVRLVVSLDVGECSPDLSGASFSFFLKSDCALCSPAMHRVAHNGDWS